jgi:hypothetical protein
MRDIRDVDILDEIAFLKFVKLVHGMQFSMRNRITTSQGAKNGLGVRSSISKDAPNDAFFRVKEH